ncbi:DNA/RNA helicase domain-containing protein [Liquorilactobacillus ghanensis]|uniref:DNA/RNA helicase domain-containing protein n=1 Tax=Liquorilactobacillus ghanensis TaxID=399370 RepID=UPI0039E842F5
MGETNDIVRRTIEHISSEKNRQDWLEINKSNTASMYIIGHKHFNKSLTLDIENKLMLYLTSVASVARVNNRRTNQQGNYYTSNEFGQIFSRLWEKLGEKNKELFPVEQIIKDSALFKASPFHKLTSEQKDARLEILNKIRSCQNKNSAVSREKGELIIVSGEAGAGKTVLMSSIFFELQNNPNILANEVYMLVNHDQQYKVYLEIAKKLGIPKMQVSKPTHFINSHNDKKAKIVLIDEAHLLLTQGKQSYRGKNQLYDILQRAEIVVAVFDENQILTTEQFWEKGDLDALQEEAKRKNNFIRLKSQLRINADLATINWIRNIVDYGKIGNIPQADSHQYEVEIFDDPLTLYKSIKSKNDSQKNGISRLVATYDWDYKQNSKNIDTFWKVKIGDFELPWNLQLKPAKGVKYKDVSWAEQPQTINEVGSTYTVQGFDLNYVGVIIGPSVKYRNGHIIYDSQASKNTKATRNRTLKNGEKQKFGETFLKNELNVLLTRGVNGLYIYAVDKQLQEALKNARV